MSNTLRHRGGPLSAHLDSHHTSSYSSNNNDEDSSQVTIKTTNKSSSKSKAFYLVLVVVFVVVEACVVAYLNVRASKSTSKSNNNNNNNNKQLKGAPVTNLSDNTSARSNSHNVEATATAAANNNQKHAFASKPWLNGQRMGNVGSGLTKDDLHKLIVLGAKGPISDIVGETVCAPESPVFLSNSTDSIPTESLAKGKFDGVLASQLMYRAIHENQFGPARKEAKVRMRHWTEDTASQTDVNGIGVFDFECLDAKFLIFQGFTAPVGLGAHLRSQMVMPILLTGLAHGRVVLYVTDEDSPMTVASCDRHDLQCSFLPMSPCVLTKEEIDQAPAISHDWDDYLKNNPNERVIRIRRDVEDHFSAAAKVGGNKLKIVENFWKPEQRQQRLNLLVAGVARIVANLYGQSDKANAFHIAFAQSLNGGEFISKVEAAAQLFITRPNRPMQREISGAVAQSFPPDYDYTKALGLPIRGSDKCLKEQECVQFKDLMKQAYSAFPMSDIRHIVLSSEDARFMASAMMYKQNTGAAFNFIHNAQDVDQASGWYQNLPANKSITVDAILTSTMISWAFQLRTGHSFLNQCSNFHRLFEASIEFGCSVASTWKKQGIDCNVIV